MRSTILRKVRDGGIAIVIALIAHGTIIAQVSDGPERTVEGVWRVTITPRNCATGEPIPTATFEALFTFHKDGTMSAWVQNATIVTTRSPSHGLWQRGQGWSDYSFRFAHLRYNLTTGAFVGRQESGGALVLSDTGDEFTTDGFTILYNVSGTPGTPSCSNSVGTRFKLES